MENIRDYFKNVFTELNINDSNIDESKFLNINLNIFDHFDGKVPMMINKNLNCLHEIKIKIDHDIKDIDKFVEEEIIKHIQETLYERPNSKIVVCMFLYSVIIIAEQVLEPVVIIKSNFKIK